MNFRKFLSVPLTIMLATGMPWSGASAYEDTTQPVEVNSGETVDVGNVTVDGSQVGDYPGYAVKVETEGTENEKAKATVHGNVDLIATESDNALIANAFKGDVTADISGDVKIKQEQNAQDPREDNIYGIRARSSEDKTTTVNVGGNVSAKNPNYNSTGIGIYENSGTTDINVDGNVSANANRYATAINNDNGNVTVKGDVSAEAMIAEGLRSYSDSENGTHNQIDGNLSAKGRAANGAILTSYWNEKANISLNAKKSITATSTGTDQYDEALGIGICNAGGNIFAEIAENIVANSAIANAIGIQFGTYSELPGEIFKGETHVMVNGNVISNGVGIHQMNIQELRSTNNVLVANEINADKVGVLIDKIPEPDEGEDVPVNSTLNLTVWKIKLNERGNVAEYTSEGDNVHKAATDFEKRIMYIIKVEQPKKGGTIKAVKADGSALETSFEYEIAREGDKILIKPTLKDGFEIVAAYNGLGEKIELTKDENGNYYLIVPKGGGVYLSAVFKEIEPPGGGTNGNNGKYHDDVTPDKSESNIIADETTESETSEIAKALSYQEKSESKAIKTGDDDHIIPWLLLSTLSIGGIVALEIYNKKKILKKANQK